MDVLSVTSPPAGAGASAGSLTDSASTSSTSAAPAAPAQPAPAATGTQAIPSADRIEQAVQQVNNLFTQQGQNLYGTVDKDKITGIYVFKIMVKDTDEVIRQLPPKEVVAFAQSLEQPQGLRGLLLQASS